MTKESLTGEALLKFIKQNQSTDPAFRHINAGYKTEKAYWKAERDALAVQAEALREKAAEEDRENCWYECSFTYDGEVYTFTADVDVAQRYEDSLIDEEALFGAADEEMPSDYNGELFEGASCLLAREGDEEQ
jgi:hypothetical protein